MSDDSKKNKDPNEKPNNEKPPEPPAERPHRPTPRRKSRRAVSARTVGRRAYQTDIAAIKLDTTASALRARIRRCARIENGVLIARLGMGVVARKFGSTWRVDIPEENDPANAT